MFTRYTMHPDLVARPFIHRFKIWECSETHRLYQCDNRHTQTFQLFFRDPRTGGAYHELSKNDLTEVESEKLTLELLRQYPDAVFAQVEEHWALNRPRDYPKLAVLGVSSTGISTCVHHQVVANGGLELFDLKHHATREKAEEQISLYLKSHPFGDHQ